MIIAASGCLLGERVRFDGGHKHTPWITQDLARYAHYVPFCPEAIAYGTPRPSIRLVHVDHQHRVWSNRDGADLSDLLSEAIEREISRLESLSLGGMIFKSRSPSCALGSGKLYRTNGMVEGKADGLFAARARAHWSDLPMIEEGQLEDAWLRENFVLHLFAYDRFEQFKATAPTIHDLIRFHTRHKFLLLSRDEMLYRQLGRLVATPDESTFQRYEALFKKAIARRGSIPKTRNVLEHMAGFLKHHLTPIEKQTLHAHIAQYYERIVPLIVPLSTLHLLAKSYHESYLLDQVFLDPYPSTLALRSRIVDR